MKQKNHGSLDRAHLMNREPSQRAQSFFQTFVMIITGITLSTLFSCHPRPSSTSELKVQEIGQIEFNRSKYQFQLFKLTPTGWDHTPKLQRTTKPITIVLHGFKPGIRTSDFGISGDEIAYRLGLTSLIDCNKPVRRVPVDRIQNREVYALAWNSVARTPWELEQIMGDNFDRQKFIKDPKIYGKELGQEPLDQLMNQPSLFALLEDYYELISTDLKKAQVSLAGFSKGGHLALKLAQILKKKEEAKRLQHQLQDLYLLDPYVGPKILNGGLGSDLISIVRELKQKNVSIINIETSQVSQFGDREFYDKLRKEVGQLTITRNAKDQRALQEFGKLRRFNPTNDLFFNHFRAPQYFLGSALLCPSELPTINTPGKKVQGSIENPEVISDWIYSGEISPLHCPR